MSNRRKIYALLIAISFGASSFNSCNRWRGQNVHKARAQLSQLNISTDLGDISFMVELADSSKKRTQGLMMRTSMPKNQGMLFIFNKLKRHIFWMKKTFISLDLVFFDDDFKVVGMIENAQPKSLKTLDIGLASRYVLELNAGSIKTHGINTGQLAHLQR